MYKFKVNEIFDMQPSLNETWPDFYSFAVQETPIGFCGGLSVALVHDCCISSLDLDASFGIASGAAMIVPDNDFDYALSKYASGGTYCVLQADEFGLVNGYDAVYILNDNTCYDKYRCSVTGKITIYNQTNCQGEIVSVALTKELSKISIGIDTSIAGRVATGTPNQIQVSWLTFMPTYLAGPWHDSHWDRFQHACIYTTILGDIVILAYAIYRFRKIKKRVLLVPVTTCFVWLLSNSFSGYFALTIAPDIDTQYNLLEVVLSLQNVATLLTVAQTTMTIVTLTKASKVFKFCIWFIVIGLHLSLAGSNYFGICWNPAVKNCIPYDTYLLWIRCMPFWYLFVFLYDILPPILIVYQISRVDKRTLWELVILDLKFTFGLIAQVLICVFYFTINYIQSSTDLLGSDAGFASVITLSSTLITFHSQMNMFTLSRLGEVLNKFSKVGSSKKSTTKKP
ncbi:hypothetical protein BC833DRAFT_662897 [Globomyces pollinis-pini]|nr:hypothetical protein BC833DRAFT_662897 [Globomyces pollinis-pini]